MSCSHGFPLGRMKHGPLTRSPVSDRTRVQTFPLLSRKKKRDGLFSVALLACPGDAPPLSISPQHHSPDHPLSISVRSDPTPQAFRDVRARPRTRPLLHPAVRLPAHQTQQNLRLHRQYLYPSPGASTAVVVNASLPSLRYPLTSAARCRKETPYEHHTSTPNAGPATTILGHGPDAARQ